MFVMFAKNVFICDTELLDMWISVEEACQFIDFSNITSLWSHNDIVLKI